MKFFMLFFMSILTMTCQNQTNDESKSKEQIIETLENETKYFCERNLVKWQAQWSHQDFTSKMYAGKVEFEDLIGWEEIKQFAVDHIKENPQAFPLPNVDLDYKIHLFDQTALVFYSKIVDNSLVRETRFMVQEDHKWKIARMQTIF